MRKRQLGATGLEVSELCLGTWGLSGEAYGPVSESDADATIDRALELGIDLFDTSDSYGKGAMETRLGARLANATTPTFVVTRHGTDREGERVVKCFRPDYLKRTFEAAQKRLQRDVIDVFVLHNPTTAAIGSNATKDFVGGLLADKKIRAWGVSAGDAETAREAVVAGAQVLEFPYNVLIGSDLHSFAALLVEKKIGVLARSILGYGLLAGMWHAEKRFGEGDHRRDRWTRDELRARISHLDAVRGLMGGDASTMRGAALRFVLANESISSAVLGPRNVAQLEQLAREAGNGPPYLEAEKLARLPRKLIALGAEI